MSTVRAGTADDGTRTGRVARRRGPLGWLWLAVKAVVCVVAAGLVVALLVVPRAVGGQALTVLTGSMVPTYRPGDMVVVKGVDPATVCDAVAVGDTVTYLPYPDDPTLITHRVTAITPGTFGDHTACRLTTQGDANPEPDEPVSPVQVRGTVLYSVPKVGYARQWLVGLLGR